MYFFFLFTLYIYTCLCLSYSTTGHNSTGQYFVTSSKLSFDCITTPRKIPLFIEKSGRDTSAVPNVVIKDVVCGTNHVVRTMQGYL